MLNLDHSLQLEENSNESHYEYLIEEIAALMELAEIDAQAQALTCLE